MTERTELRRLLEAYRTAPTTDAAVDAYQEYREAAVNALPSLLDQLDAVDAERDRVVRLTGEQAEHIRWALRFAKHESEDRELDALLDGATIFARIDGGEQS